VKKSHRLGARNAAHYKNVYFLVSALFTSYYDPRCAFLIRVFGSTIAKLKWLRVAPGCNLWVPVSKDSNLQVAWVKMKGMAAKRLELKALLRDLGVDNSMRYFGTLIGSYLPEDTQPSKEEDGKQDSDELGGHGSEEEVL
jgi:hypothetical protein